MSLSSVIRPTSMLLRSLARPFSISARLAEERSKTLFVGSLNFETTRAALQKPFEEFGHVTSTRIITSNGRSKGFGYVEFDKEADAEKALEALNGADVDGFNIRLDFAAPRAEAMPAPESTRVFYGNLPYNLGEQELKELLKEEFGVENATVSVPPPTADRFGQDGDEMSRDAQNRGFGFIEFDSLESSKAFLATVRDKVDGGYTMAGGKVPRANYQTPRQDRGSGGGSRGGFGGGRGGFGGGERRSFDRRDGQRDGGRDNYRSGGGDRSFGERRGGGGGGGYGGGGDRFGGGDRRGGGGGGRYGNEDRFDQTRFQSRGGKREFDF